MDELERSVDRVAVETGFSGVVHVDVGGDVVVAKAYGNADRGRGIPNSPGTRFAVASGTKGLTALVVVGLIEEGRLDLATTARSVLGPDLPLVDDDVTVEQLLAHRSGIGDYLDEDAERGVNDYVLPVPVHRLARTEDYLGVLDGHPQAFRPGTRFSYNNSGFVLLALIAERVSGTGFHDLVRDRVCAPAGMGRTAFLRSDEPAGDAAVGYLEATGPRTNVLHLPVRGTGDGGVFTTAADVVALWRALFGGRILGPAWVAEMVRPRSEQTGEELRYGLGFWLHSTSSAVVLVGSDAGVSFQTVHDPSAGLTHTVLSNTSRGAWPVARLLRDTLTP